MGDRGSSGRNGVAKAEWRDPEIELRLKYGTCKVCEPGLPHRTASHCRECHAAWKRSSASMHCVTCHRTFSSPAASDAHLQPVGCKDPTEVTFVKGPRKGRRVLADPELNEYGTSVWAFPAMSEDVVKRLRGSRKTEPRVD